MEEDRRGAVRLRAAARFGAGRRWRTRMLVVKGAPEDILRLSTHYEAKDARTVRGWDTAAREAAQRQLETLGAQGLRVLGIAFKEVGKDHDHAGVSDEAELVLGGFAAFLDPPKASAAKPPST